MIQIKTHQPTHFVAPQHHQIIPRTAARSPWLRQLLRRLFTLPALLLLATSGALPPALAQEQAQQLPTLRLTAGMHLITAELARSPAERGIGLMHRSSMPSHHGMLFVFEEPGLHCFWMKNTLLPLSIAFLADDGRIVNIADMQPRSEVSHCPKQAVRLALEMNQGWFAKRGLKAGSQIGGEVFSAR